MPEPHLPQKLKTFDPKDPNPCAGCSNCCEYICLEIDRPTTVKDFDQIFWYVIHKDVWVYIDGENDWYLQVINPCEKLKDKRCTYYEHRPYICREYMPSDCLRYNTEVDEKYLFKNEEDLIEYLKKKRPAMFSKMSERLKLTS